MILSLFGASVSPVQIRRRAACPTKDRGIHNQLCHVRINRKDTKSAKLKAQQSFYREFTSIKANQHPH